MLKGEEAFWDFRLESEVIQPTSSDYKDLLYILDFSTAHRFHVIPSVADSVTETEVLNSILLSVTSDAPKVTKPGVPIVIKSDDLSILPFSAAPWSRVISSVGTANAESKILSRSSDARPNSAASNPTVIESVTPIATEIDASEKHSPALDDVVAASVAVAPKGDATLSDLDYVSLISKVFLASELSPHFKQNVRAVISQIPTYIFLPNTLFHTGWMDISNQNKQLEALRTVFHQSLKIDKNPAFFLRGQSESYHYDSNLSALEYGYGGELDYNAMEVGTLLKNIESVYSTTSFGVMGTYGKLSLQPLDVEQSQKSIFDKWFVTAYGSVQHDTGFYIDSLLSYGLFSGNIFTLARSKTATLRGNPLSVSLAAGKAFRIGYENFVLDPQIQFVYQHLRFRKTHDVDGFDIDMRKPDYWMMRVGGRLTKTLAVIEKARVLSFYGQLHFIRNFDNKQFVYFGDTFLLGDFGSSLENGFGVYAHLSSKITFHSNLIYSINLPRLFLWNAFF